MAQKKAFLLRLEPSIHDAVQRWADADMRSVNAQIEFLLRRALQQAGRLPKASGQISEDGEDAEKKKDD